jgi:hypothetical protein
LNELDEFLSETTVKRFLLHVFETSVIMFTENIYEVHWTQFRIRHERNFGPVFTGDTMLSLAVSAQAYLYGTQVLQSRKGSVSDNLARLLHLSISNIPDDPGAEPQADRHINFILLLLRMGASPNSKFDVHPHLPHSPWELAVMRAWYRSRTHLSKSTSFDYKVLSALTKYGSDPDSRIELEDEVSTTLEVVTNMCSGNPETTLLLDHLKERHTQKARIIPLGQRFEGRQSAFETTVVEDFEERQAQMLRAQRAGKKLENRQSLFDPNSAAAIAERSPKSIDGVSSQRGSLNEELLENVDGRRPKKREPFLRFLRISKGRNE